MNEAKGLANLKITLNEVKLPKEMSKDHAINKGGFDDGSIRSADGIWR